VNVLVPLNDGEMLSEFVEAGAGEFYIGFHDEEWDKKFGDYADINRMSGFKKRANRYNPEEVAEIIQNVKKTGKSIYLTLNASAYSDAETDALDEYLKFLAPRGLDGAIISDAGLIPLARKHNLIAVASAICGIYNEDVAKFYIERGCGRLILPRDIPLAQIEAIKNANPYAEYEVFIMRNGCVFSDSNCLGEHKPQCGALCSYLKRPARIQSDLNDFKSRHDFELNYHLYKNYFFDRACGLCAIYRFIALEISAAKAVGRADSPRGVLDDVALISKNIEIAKASRSEKEYLENMIFPEDRAEVCRLGFSCYYPEIRFGD
jgi:putative protease